METTQLRTPEVDADHAHGERATPTVPEADGAVVGIFKSHAEAEEVVKELQRSGFDMKRLSVVGKGYHSEDRPVGFYNTGDRMKAWGGMGAFWGAIWGILFGAAFFWVPGFGPLAVAGPFVQMLAAGLEGAVVVGGAGALGGALMGMGIPRDSVLKYETSLKANNYLVIAHGTPDEVEAARLTLHGSALEEPEVVG